MVPPFSAALPRSGPDLRPRPTRVGKFHARCDGDSADRGSYFQSSSDAAPAHSKIQRSKSLMLSVNLKGPPPMRANPADFDVSAEHCGSLAAGRGAKNVNRT